MDLESRVDEYFILIANKTRGGYVIGDPIRFKNRLIWKHGTESWYRMDPLSDAEERCKTGKMQGCRARDAFLAP